MGNNMKFFNTEVELKELRLYKEEHERLKRELNTLLYPNGDGPVKPSFCDLVGYVREDRCRQEKKNQRIRTIGHIA